MNNAIIIADYALTAIVSIAILLHALKKIDVAPFRWFTTAFTFGRRINIWQFNMRLIPLVGVVIAMLHYNIVDLTIVVFAGALFLMVKSALHHGHSRNVRATA